MSEPLATEGCLVTEAALELTDNEDVLSFISEKDIKILNLCHIPEDSRLKNPKFHSN